MKVGVARMTEFSRSQAFCSPPMIRIPVALSSAHPPQTAITRSSANRVRVGDVGDLAVAADPASSDVIFVATATTTASIIRTNDIDDKKTDQQQQQPDSVDDVTDDSSQKTSGTESEVQFSDANTNSSSCHFPSNIIAMSTVKLPAGMYIHTCTTVVWTELTTLV